MIKAVFFDLDGTLVDSAAGLMNSMNIVMRKFGFDEISPEQTKQFIGNGYRVFTEKALQAAADRLYEKAEKLEKKDPDAAMELEMQADDVLAAYDEACAEYLRAYALHYLDGSAAYPGMKETLEELRSRGLRLACITNKPEIAASKTLEQVFGKDIFDYLVCDDGIIPKKPDITGCRRAMAALGVNADEVVYAGDTGTDMLTAKNAGFKAVGCLYGFRDKKELVENGADYLIKEARELTELIDRLS